MERLKSKGGPEYGNFIMHWYDDYDLGLKNNWSAADLDDSSWKPVQIPGGFLELGVPDAPSVCWFRNEISLPDPLPPGKATIFLGVIERMDTTLCQRPMGRRQRVGRKIRACIRWAMAF